MVAEHLVDWNWAQGLVLGLVQGLTEFIPVSSTAHLRIVPALLGWDDPGTAFSAVIQLGTLAAVLVYFQADIRRLGLAALYSLWRPAVRAGQDARLAWAIALGNLPIIVAGLTLRGVIETHFRSLLLIGAMLIVVALALAWAEWRRRGPQGRPGGEVAMAALGWRRVLAIGVFQALALIPGSSRSGTTILGGLLLGMSRAEAARFSFLLGIPAILGSGLLQLPVVLGGAGGMPPGALWAGLGASALSGYLSIAFLLHFLRRHTTLGFVAYRLGLGGLVLWLALGEYIR